MYHAFNVVDDGFQLWRSYRPLLASFQQSLQNLLTLETLAAAVFLDDHVGNFVDALVGGEAAATFQAFAAAADGVAGAAFAGINDLVVHVRAERALHSAESPDVAEDLAAAPTASSMVSSSVWAMRRNSPRDMPS